MKEHCTPLDPSLKRSLPNQYFQGCLTLHLHDELMSNVPLQYKRIFLRARDRLSTSNPNMNTTYVKERAHGPDLSLWALRNSMTGLSQFTFSAGFKTNLRLSSLALTKLSDVGRHAFHFSTLRFWSGVTRRGLGGANKHPNSRRPSRVLMSEVVPALCGQQIFLPVALLFACSVVYRELKIINQPSVALSVLFVD